MTPSSIKPPPHLSPLRAMMQSQQLNWVLLLSCDAHQSEYSPEHWQVRQAFTGFRGSAGDALVGTHETHLWVDSRYHLQAEQQAPWASIHKLGEKQVVSWLEWLVQKAQTGQAFTLGIHPMQVTMRLFQKIACAFKNSQAKVVLLPQNSLHEAWTHAPKRPGSKVFALPKKWTGESAKEKLSRVRRMMASHSGGMDALLLTRLDEVAWLSNLRGRDVPHNPVFESWLLITPNQAFLYSDNPLQAIAQQTIEGVFQWLPYDGVYPQLAALAKAKAKVWLDPNAVNMRLAKALEGAVHHTTPVPPVMAFKAQKNTAEIKQSEVAHLRAGCAFVRALYALETQLKTAQQISEARFASSLFEEYAKEEDFVELSFPTIAGYGPNAAIVHYGTPSKEVFLQPGSMLLVDSGIQIAGATTDATRTIAIGPPSPLLCARYTQVLRGHIRLAQQIFPEDCSGQALDALARSVLWQQGLDFGHGTGHGVGAFLNVHEGPYHISPRVKSALRVGVIISNEPGWYQDGWGGIRCENLYVVEEASHLSADTSGRKWLRFRPLTLMPFDSSMIQWKMLSHEELAWLTNYHRHVCITLSPSLQAPQQQWLSRACAIPVMDAPLD